MSPVTSLRMWTCRSRRADEGDEIALPDLEIGGAEGLHHALAAAIREPHVLKLTKVGASSFMPPPPDGRR